MTCGLMWIDQKKFPKVKLSRFTEACFNSLFGKRMMQSTSGRNEMTSFIHWNCRYVQDERGQLKSYFVAYCHFACLNGLCTYKTSSQTIRFSEFEDEFIVII